MRRSRNLLWGTLLPLAVLLAAPSAAAAAQGPDHLHLDVSSVGCDRVDVSGYKLPEDTRLSLRYADAGSGRVLHTQTVRSGADGRVKTSAKVSLDGVTSLRVGVVPQGQTQATVFGETLVSQRCPLPFTGPSSDLALLLAGVVATLIGAAAVLWTAPRGRHVRR